MERAKLLNDTLLIYGRKGTMTILESLREKKTDIDFNLCPDFESLINQYDLALENAVLKLGNRAVQIKDLQNRIKALENTKVGISTLRVIH